MALDLDKVPPAVAELLQCSICLEQLSDPKTLLCQHSFCTHCLLRWTRRLAKQKNGREPKVLACPACRTPTPLGKEGVTGLPADFKVNKLAEFFTELAQAAEQKEESKKKFLCDLCQGHQAENDQDEELSAGRAEKYCENCQEYLCKACHEKHRSAAIFRSHHIVDANRPIVFKPCTVHSHKLQKYFCTDCQIAVCSSCVTNSHSNHEVTEIPTLLETRRNAITSVLDDVIERLKNLHDNRVSKRTVTVVGTQYAQVEHKVRQHMRNIAYMLAQKEQSLLRDLRMRRDAILTSLMAEANKTQHDWSLLRSLKMYSADILDSDSLGDINNLMNHAHDVLEKELLGSPLALSDVKGIQFIAEIPSLDIGHFEETVLPEHGRKLTDDSYIVEGVRLPSETKPSTPNTSRCDPTGFSHTPVVYEHEKVLSARPTTSKSSNKGASTEGTCSNEPFSAHGNCTEPQMKKTLKEENRRHGISKAKSHPSRGAGKNMAESMKNTLVFPQSPTGTAGFAALGGDGLGFLTGLGTLGMIHKSHTLAPIESASLPFEEDNRYSEDEDETEYIQCAGKLEWKRNRPGKGPDHLGFPSDASFLSGGELVVSDVANHRLQLLDTKGELVKCIGSGTIHPMGVATIDGDTILMTDTKDKCLKILSPRGHSTTMWSHVELQEPCGVAVSRDGKWVVTDKRKHTAMVFTQQGQCISQFGGYGVDNKKFACPFYCATDALGRVIISDNENHALKIFDSNGRYIRTIGKLGTGLGDMFYPHGVCIDRQNNIFVADCKNHRVSMFSPDGRFMQNVLTSEDSVAGPVGLAYLTKDNQDLLAVTRCNKNHPSVSVFRVASL